MNPIYKFQLSAGQDTRQASPVYKDDLAIDYGLEQNQQFYRGKLTGKLTFQKDDYAFIRAKSFDTQFDVVISISYDGGQTWAVYWSGQFWKTDCQFNEDDETAIVTPTVNDRYNAVLAGMEKEYNLIDLAPAMQPVKLDKRPMVQVYVPGQTVVGCFLSGMWWEQECKAVNETDTVEIGGQTYPALEYKYHFAFNKGQRQINVTQSGTPTIPDVFFGEMPENVTTNYEYVNGGYKFKYTWTTQGQYVQVDFEIVRVADDVTLWSYQYTGQNPPMDYPLTVTLEPVSGTDAIGVVELYLHDVKVYSRYVTDVEQALGLTTYPIPDDDIVENNRNYHYVIGYYFPNTIHFYDGLSETPTQWGLYQPGLYYQMFTNPIYGINESFPIARSAWGRVSIWFAFDLFDWITEQNWRNEYTLKDAFPIWAVISALLSQIAPGITHAGTADYSQFLYDTNPISGVDQRLFITTKSNLISAGYDQPAQKAPITLKSVTNMLRDCFRCYWFIDENNRFRVEHISYFMRGGTYTGTPVVGIDLTVQKVTRNGKPWAYARNQYQFDKPEMAARYQFGWMDDVTDLFDGFPIDILSKYVNPDNIEQIDVSQFTSDVDYILLNPGAVSKDGFALLAGVFVEAKEIEQYNVTAYPQINRQLGTDGKWMTNSNKHILIPVVPGERLRITAGASYGAQLAWFTSDAAPVAGADAPLVPGTSRFSRTKNTTGYYDVPAGANYLYVFWGTSGEPGAYLPAGIALVHQPGYFLQYVNFTINLSNHILQNGLVAFAYLQQYYLFDMPAWNVAINGVQQIVQGIKKLKTQTIKFPVLTEPNLTNLIKTELGNGTIQKMSVNLSSRNANTTLKYDTE